MKLSTYISRRLIGSMLIILILWSALFYLGILNEVNDETDDVLEDYSTMLIQRTLAGEKLPSIDNGSNNTYKIEQLTAEQAEQLSTIEFVDEQVFIEYKSEYEPARIIRRVFKAADGQYYLVTVATPSLDKADMILAIAILIVVLYLLLFVVISFSNTVIIRRCTKPLRQLIDYLDKKELDKGAVAVKIDNRIDEFKRLSEEINAFVDRHTQLFEQQREFIANASHELQTPIAVCQNRLELMMDSKLDEQQLEMLGKSLATLSQISKFNRSLLLLSRIDNGDFNSEQFDIREMVIEGVESCQEIYFDKKVTLEWLSQQSCIVEMNRSLAQIMVNNLIKNAFVHGVSPYMVSISLSDQGLSVTNKGLDVALNERLLFQRFNRSSNTNGSSGLGLSIIAAICKLYNYNIKYHFDSRNHTFFIKFR